MDKEIIITPTFRRVAFLAGITLVGFPLLWGITILTDPIPPDLPAFESSPMLSSIVLALIFAAIMAIIISYHILSFLYFRMRPWTLSNERLTIKGIFRPDFSILLTDIDCLAYDGAILSIHWREFKKMRFMHYVRPASAKLAISQWITAKANKPEMPTA